VVGLTMQLWNQRRLPEPTVIARTDSACLLIDDVYDARPWRSTGMPPLRGLNYEQRSKKTVAPFVRQYLAGRNPDSVHFIATTTLSSIHCW